MPPTRAARLPIARLANAGATVVTAVPAATAVHAAGLSWVVLTTMAVAKTELRPVPYVVAATQLLPTSLAARPCVATQVVTASAVPTTAALAIQGFPGMETLLAPFPIPRPRHPTAFASRMGLTVPGPPETFGLRPAVRAPIGGAVVATPRLPSEAELPMKALPEAALGLVLRTSPLTPVVAMALQVTIQARLRVDVGPPA